MGSTMFVVKNSFCKVSKVGLFPPQLFSFNPKVSRACFTSTSKFRENKHAREDVGAGEDAKAAERLRQVRQVYENDEEAEEVERKYKEMKHKAKHTIDDMKDGGAKYSAQEGSSEKARERAQRVEETMHDAKERTKDTAEKAKAGAKRVGKTMHDAKESTKDTAEWTAKKAKEGAEKAGEAVKETAKEVLETAKDTTQKIKDKVVGKDEQ